MRRPDRFRDPASHAGNPSLSRWNDGTDQRPKAWYIDIGEDKRDAELQWLKTEIFGRNVDLTCREITALDRYSARH